MPFILESTITGTFQKRVQTTPDVLGFRTKLPTGEWNQLSFKDFDFQMRIAAHGLLSLGIEEGAKVAIFSNTRIEWPQADMAILSVRGITVPIYASNTADDAAFILNHSESVALFVEDSKQLSKILEKRAELKFLKHIIVFEPGAMGQASGLSEVISWQSLGELGRRHKSHEPNRIDELTKKTTSHETATICYTSGTTGIPKGVMLSHDNVMSVLEDCVKLLGTLIRPEKEVLVTFLPFSHIIGKLESIATYVFGWQECYAVNFDTLSHNLTEIKPTLIFAVPRVFEKAFNRVHTTTHSGPEWKADLFEKALRVGKKYVEENQKAKAGGEPRKLSLKTRIEYALFDKLVFSRIRDRFGGNLRHSICGGAPLPAEIGAFFQIAGINILEGYGLTETAAPVTVMTPSEIRFGTVGRPLPEVAIKIAEDGEILIKSRKVFQGYYKNQEETAAVMTDGWFHTGDIGHIDYEGFLKITDRKKDLIITSGGKNIAPQKIENLAKSFKFINQFVVHGDQRNYLTALVTLDKEQVVQYANEHQILFSDYAELTKHAKIVAKVQKIIDELNLKLASFETIKRFAILPTEFTVDSGEMTPSLKIKRKVVSDRHKTTLDAMYE